MLFFVYFLCISYAFAQKSNSTFFDDGFLYSCPSKVFDLMISNDATHSLQIVYVVNENVRRMYNISNAAEIIKHKSFDKKKSTVVFAHGYAENIASGGTAISQFVNHYTNTNNNTTNLILLNSNSLIGLTLYFKAARVARYAGYRFGMLLIQMVKTGLDFEKLQLVGHGLGSHILGYSGKIFYKRTGKLIPHLVALDPTGPCFRTSSPEERIDKGDARFVQVMHTNGGALGLRKAVGHVDWFINGGLWQPGEPGTICLVICSHYRAVSLWIVTLTHPKAFNGYRCNSEAAAEQGKCAQTIGNISMGENISKQTTGIFYINTTNVSPFFK